MADRDTIAKVMKATRIAILTYEDEQSNCQDLWIGVSRDLLIVSDLAW